MPNVSCRRILHDEKRKHTSTSPAVLLVDDEPAVLKLCRLILEREGFTVFPASGSSEALKICKTQPVDILVTDLVLPAPGFSFASEDNEFPHVHGHEHAVRALRMRETLRVVLMSGNVEKDLTGYGIRLGSVPVLSKIGTHYLGTDYAQKNVLRCGAPQLP
ncbi:MAG TPA: response regulator [Nitrospira sp.]